MSNVDLSIGGREFKVSCSPGEEGHITALGRMIDSKVSGMGMAGQSEGRMLLFASLLLADEVHEKQGRSEGASAAPVPALAPAAESPELAEKLESIAAALERCALALEA